MKYDLKITSKEESHCYFNYNDYTFLIVISYGCDEGELIVYARLVINDNKYGYFKIDEMWFELLNYDKIIKDFIKFSFGDDDDFERVINRYERWKELEYVYENRKKNC